MSVRSGPLTSRARGKFHVSATEHLQHPVAVLTVICFARCIEANTCLEAYAIGDCKWIFWWIPIESIVR